MDDFDFGSSFTDTSSTYTSDPTPTYEAPAASDPAPCIVPDSNQGQDANSQNDAPQCDPQQLVEHHHHHVEQSTDTAYGASQSDRDNSGIDTFNQYLLLHNLQSPQFAQDVEREESAKSVSYRGAQPFYPQRTTGTDGNWGRSTAPTQGTQVDITEKPAAFGVIGLASAIGLGALGIFRLGTEAVTAIHGGNIDVQNALEGAADLAAAGAGLRVASREPGERGPLDRMLGLLCIALGADAIADAGLEIVQHYDALVATPVIAHLAEDVLGVFGATKMARWLNHSNTGS